MKKLIIIALVFFLKTNGFAQETSSNDLEASNEIKKAESYIKIQDFKNAIVHYTAALGKATDKLPVYEKRSVAHLLDKNYEDALLDYEKIIELEKTPEKLGAAYFYRGLCKLMLQQFEESDCDDLSKAKKLGFKAEWDNFVMFCPTIAD